MTDLRQNAIYRKMYDKVMTKCMTAH